MSQNYLHRRFSIRGYLERVRNAGVSHMDTPPRARGLRFMNLSSLVAALLVLCFGVPLAIISRQYSIVILAIPVAFLYFSVIILNFIKDYVIAVWAWQFTFCASTYLFGMLEREVIDATHMIPFLVAAPAFVLWKAEYRSKTLPGCILLAVLTYVGMEISSVLNLLPALPLKQYYWYFRPATLATIYSLNVMVFWKLLKEMDVVFLRLANSIQEEQNAKVQVERYAEQMQLYASIITHEIKTPLSALKSIAVAFQDAATSDDKATCMDRADACVNHLQAVVDNAQFLANLNSGDPPVVADETFNVRALISEIVSFFSYEAKKRRVNIAYSCGAEMPDHINGDAQSVRQIVINLISNAIKFSRKDTTIYIRITGMADKWRICVEDQGKGIAPHALNRIFEKYFSTNEDNRRGVGIGLYVSSKLAELMQGNLKVESIVGRGTVFSLTLPMRPTKLSHTDVSIGQGYRIEIIEDSVLLGSITSEQLEKYGFTTKLALTGEEGIEQALQFEPDLILLDLSLPDMNGNAVVNRLHQHPQLAKIPVIILTGERLGESATNSLLNMAGVVGYIHKPLGKSGIDKVLTIFRSRS